MGSQYWAAWVFSTLYERKYGRMIRVRRGAASPWDTARHRRKLARRPYPAAVPYPTVQQAVCFETVRSRRENFDPRHRCLVSISSSDRAFLARAVDLAAEAARTGNDPFGSVLVSDSGELLAEDRNRVGDLNDPTRHPEIALSRWAATNLDADQRRSSTVYTSGEHCVMCSASHGIVGLGRIVYATSTAQLLTWLQEFGAAPLAIMPLPIERIVPGIVVDGPVAEFGDTVRELHRQRHASA